MIQETGSMISRIERTGQQDKKIGRRFIPFVTSITHS
jgi:hypothetical protein